jgi:hypothetical protein
MKFNCCLTPHASLWVNSGAKNTKGKIFIGGESFNCPFVLSLSKDVQDRLGEPQQGN